MLYVQTTPIYVCSQRININFSALEKIPRFGFETDQPNKVLVLLVTNVQFNVNANVSFVELMCITMYYRLFTIFASLMELFCVLRLSSVRQTLQLL